MFSNSAQSDLESGITGKFIWFNFPTRREVVTSQNVFTLRKAACTANALQCQHAQVFLFVTYEGVQTLSF